MAQPPLSAAIRQLEQELGAELLLRTTREVRLTEAGATFLEGARRTLAELDRAPSDAQRAAAGDLGSLRVGFSWNARFETLPAIGRAVSKHRDAYTYLPESVRSFPEPEALARRITAAGFKDVSFARLSGGICAVHDGTR